MNTFNFVLHFDKGSVFLGMQSIFKSIAANLTFPHREIADMYNWSC